MSTVEPASIVALDVDYRGDHAIAAAVGLVDFTDPGPFAPREHLARVAPVADYEPGAFYRRELPCLLAVLALLPAPPTIVLVDGYVWLARGRAGLGAHLYERLVVELPDIIVIGVGKTMFHGNDVAVPVLRGGSGRPLFVTSVGMPVTEAAEAIARMAGEHRVPVALRRVDRLCREG